MDHALSRACAFDRVFRRSYVQIQVCGPSRSSLLTSRRPDSTRIIATPAHSWCWCERGMFMTLPRYFRDHGYVTAGGGKIFHPNACNQAGHTGSTFACDNKTTDCAACNFSHSVQGDDGNAWTLPYFPP